MFKIRDSTIHYKGLAIPVRTKSQYKTAVMNIYLAERFGLNINLVKEDLL